MIKTKKHLAFVLKVQQYEFDNIISNIDNYYYEKEKIKINEDGKPKVDKNNNPKKRIINPSINRLKQIQKRIQKNILLTIELPDYAFGSVKKRDSIRNAKMHKGKKHKLKTDLRDFFPSINHKRVFAMFRTFNFSPTVSRILTQLTTYKGRLPQGAPTSPTIANLVFIKTGKKLQKFAKENKITFTSYIDDLVFSSPIDFKNNSKLILDIIKSDGFRICYDKTSYGTKTVVTGLYPKQNYLELTESFKKKLINLKDKTSEQIKGFKLYEEQVKKANQ